VGFCFMFQRFRQNKIAVFFISASLLYLSWFLLYELVIKPHTLFDEKVISNIIFFSSRVLSFFNHNVYLSNTDIDMQMVGIDGAHPVWIGGPCNAVTLMALFSIFIIVFPGSIKNKLWFVPLGILVIHILNIFRVSALAAIAFYAPEYLGFNHTYTFTIIMYSFIFWFWIIWVNRFSKFANA
jgi:exosortase family protein XrtF